MATKSSGISRLKPPNKVVTSFESSNSTSVLVPIINNIPQRRGIRRSKSFNLDLIQNKHDEPSSKLPRIAPCSSKLPAFKFTSSQQTVPTNTVKTPLQPRKVVPVIKPSISVRPTIKKTGPSEATVSKDKPSKPVGIIAARKRRSEVKLEKVWKQPAKFVDFKTRYNSLSEKFKQRGQDLKNCNEEIAGLVTKNEENTIERQALKSEIQHLKKNNDELKKENDTQFSKITELNTDIEKVHYEINSLKQSLNSTTQKLCDKQNEVLQCHEELQSLKEALKLKDQELLERHNEILDCREKLKSLKETLNSTRQELFERNNEIVEYSEKLRKADYDRRDMLNSIQDLKGNIRVFCRVRPPLKNEEERELAQIIVLDETSMELQKSNKDNGNMKNPQGKLEFCYDKVFPAGSTQEMVFEDLSELVQSTLDGYNICVFAYGQTGSGKTFTMQGNRENLGMIPRAIDLLFKKVEEMNNLGWTFTIHASFLEIYNEAIVDLLNPKSKQQYDIRHTKETTTVTNLTLQKINSATELFDLMYTAQQNRAVASTNFNEHSSRSHAITKIDIEGVQAITNLIYRSSMNLVDLAGSESAKTSTNERLKETKSINKSLSTLGNVMLSLHNKDSHIPYRDSKLTYLLQPCLGGNSKTLMIVNIAPFEETFNETINSLRFAAKVKEVKGNIKRNRFNRSFNYLNV